MGKLFSLQPISFNAEDGVRWNQKKVQWTFFPPNRPTSHLWRGDLEPTGSRGAASWKQKSIPFGMLFLFLMRKMGLEPTRYCYHRHLKPARLPIPPLPRTAFRIISFLSTNVNRKFDKFETPRIVNTSATSFFTRFSQYFIKYDPIKC